MELWFLCRFSSFFPVCDADEIHLKLEPESPPSAPTGRRGGWGVQGVPAPGHHAHARPLGLGSASQLRWLSLPPLCSALKERAR